MELFGAVGSAMPSLTECSIRTIGSSAGLRGHQKSAREDTHAKTATNATPTATPHTHWPATANATAAPTHSADAATPILQTVSQDTLIGDTSCDSASSADTCPNST